jgi:hypothetical protein
VPEKGYCLSPSPGITADVLHDRPPSFFGPTEVAERHELFEKLTPQFEAFQIPARFLQSGRELQPGETMFTEV